MIVIVSFVLNSIALFVLVVFYANHIGHITDFITVITAYKK